MPVITIEFGTDADVFSVTPQSFGDGSQLLKWWQFLVKVITTIAPMLPKSDDTAAGPKGESGTAAESVGTAGADAPPKVNEDTEPTPRTNPANGTAGGRERTGMSGRPTAGR